ELLTGASPLCESAGGPAPPAPDWLKLLPQSVLLCELKARPHSVQRKPGCLWACSDKYAKPKLLSHSSHLCGLSPLCDNMCCWSWRNGFCWSMPHSGHSYGLRAAWDFWWKRRDMMFGKVWLHSWHLKVHSRECIIMCLVTDTLNWKSWRHRVQW
uniref:Uncharacterized protein n=1 Tax=Xiphophorus maculatus TaxID=8083 RepID=A0A3B5PQX6_XIPMA